MDIDSPEDKDKDAEIEQLKAERDALREACQAGVFYAGGPMRDETDEQRRIRLDVCRKMKAAIKNSDLT